MPYIKKKPSKILIMSDEKTNIKLNGDMILLKLVNIVRNDSVCNINVDLCKYFSFIIESLHERNRCDMST